MPAKGIHPIVKEYHLLWEALRHYQERLEKLSSMSVNEDDQLKYDEKLQDIEFILKSIKMAAQNDYQMDLK
jgi:hypothetical protein